MKIISAIGSFKGSIDSKNINEIVKRELENKGHSVESIPVADGGDGLLDALVCSLNGEYIEVPAVNALGKEITAKVGKVGNVGVVEMALASGVAILKENELNPLKASTYGTGLLIKQLAEQGVERIILGIGGSATNDGGFGCLSALGYEFYDEDNNQLSPSGENLAKICRISALNVPECVKNLNIQIACDVTNPLLGNEGATYIYGPQKGADDNALRKLEEGMQIYADVVAEFSGKDLRNLSGAGAAGGLGYGISSFLNAKLQKGAEIVLEYAGYEEKLSEADLVITGEGRVDNQTAFGKLPQIVASKANEKNVKCIAIAGSSTADSESLKKMCISQVYQLVDFAPLEKCMNNTEDVLKTVLNHIFK